MTNATRSVLRAPRITLGAFVLLLVIMPGPSDAIPITGGRVSAGGVAQAIGLAADLSTLFGLGGSVPTLGLQVSGTDTDFSLTVVGGAIVGDLARTISGTATAQGTLTTGQTVEFTLWTYSLMLDLFDRGSGFVSLSDRITINGFVEHTFGPHPPEGTGPQLTFNVVANAATAPALPDGSSTIIRAASSPLPDLPHTGLNPPDRDVLLQADINATVNYVPSLFRLETFRDISGFTFQARAVHTPEPSTVALLGSGLAAVAALALARKRQRLHRRLGSG
jgi:hypothetical protein